MVQLRMSMGLLAAVACLSAVMGGGTPNLDSMQALYDHISEQCSSPDDQCFPPDDRGLPANGEEMDPQRTVGFLSEANYHSARHSLPATAFAYIADNADEMRVKVENGEIIAAMIKGAPLDPNDVLNKWPSDTVTPQAVFLAPGQQSRSMTEAVDASIVRMLSAGKAQEARQNNLPNNHMEIHTCKAQADDLDKFPFPPADLVMSGSDSVLKTVLTTRTLKLAEYAASARTNNCGIRCTCGETATLPPSCSNPASDSTSTCSVSFVAADTTGPESCPTGCNYYEGTDSAVCHEGFGDSWDPVTKCCDCEDGSMTCTGGDDWVQDGNYTTAPFTGFWPEYTDSIIEEFKTFYDSAEQLAALPSDVARTPIQLERVWCGWTCTEALLAGEAHMTAPYFVVDGFYGGRSRTSQLGSSCTTMGGPNTFFTLKLALPDQMIYPGPDGSSLTAEDAATLGLVLDAENNRWVQPTAPCPTPQASGGNRRQLQPVEAMESLLPYLAPLLGVGGLLATAAGQQAR